MAGIYIFIILICRVIQAYFDKKSSNHIQNVTMLTGYITFQNLISALLGIIIILIANNGFRVNFATVLIAGLSGLSLFFAIFCSIYAMKSGTVSLNSIFGTAGLIIPIIAGMFLFQKPVAPLQLVGLGLFFVAAYLLIGASKSVYSNFSYKTMLLLIGSMVSNGCTMLMQQMFTVYVPDGDVSIFSFLSFGIIAVLSGIFYQCRRGTEKGKETKLTKPLVVCGLALAGAVFIINQFATMCTKLVSPVILFTFINGGATIISTLVGAIVYKEQISKKSAAGIILGIFALVLIKMFEV